MSNTTSPDVHSDLDRAIDGLLAEHEVSPAEGFLLPIADRLPEPFAPWERLGGQLPSWLAAGRLAREVAALPVLDPGPLLDDVASLRRAKLLLAFAAQALAFGGEAVVEALPEALSAPLTRIAAALEVPPIMSYADYVLGNWERIDADRPLTLDNARVRRAIYGGTDEAWFMLVHIVMEARAAPLLRACVEARMAADGGPGDLVGAVGAISGHVAALEQMLVRMRERCDPYVYYKRVRPFTHGWYRNPGLPAGGMRFASDPPGQLQSWRGETGAQSSIVPLVDAALGVEHPDDALNEHLVQMRDYMPRPHRELLRWMGESAVRRAATGDAGPLREAYERAICALSAFRRTHLDIARDYVFAFRDSDAETPANSATLGTGGTPPMAYLEHHWRATDETSLDS